MNREIRYHCIVIGNNGQLIKEYHEWLDGDGWKHDYYSPLVTNGVFSHEELGDGWMGDIIRRSYIGLKDSAGKNIYEGNIMKGEFGTGVSGKNVRYKEFYFSVIFTVGNSGSGFKIEPPSNLGVYRFYPYISQCKIMGDIFTTPELLNNNK